MTGRRYRRFGAPGIASCLMGDRRWAGLGVRSRATGVAVLVVAVAFAAGTYGLLGLTSNRIESSITEAAVARADSVVALLAADAVVDPLPGRDPELLAQIVGPGGEVVAADRAIAGIPPLVSVELAVGGDQVLIRDDILEGYENEAAGLEDQGPYAVAVRGVALPDGPGTVLVAASLEDAAQARNAVLPLLGIGLPLLLILVGVTVWLLTGRALRPVAEMSLEAGRISALALDRRLPYPAARDELFRLAETLNDMLDRLETSAIKRTRFVADASHELKSPLAAMRTMVDVATAEGAGDAELIGDIDQEIERMQLLVTDLLFLARHDETQVPARLEEVDLDQVVLSALPGGISEARIDTSGITPARILGDPDVIWQLIRNVVDNALRHASSIVWVETVERDGRAVALVSDDGDGIPAAEADRIFERFVRLDESRTRDTGGSGLGLAVARTIARDHGGDLVVAEPRHEGATFEAWFPLPAR